MREYTTDTPVFRESIPIVEENDLVNEENDTAAAKQLLPNILVLMKTKVDMEIGKSLVSEDEREMWNGIYEQATGYVDLAISNMINGAPSTLDTLGEIAQAMRENDNVVDALDAAIGTKASQAEVDSHTGNNTIHITASERQTWNSKQSTTGDTKDNTVSFTSGDATNPTGWANVALIGSGETHSSLWRKVSLLFKNVRYIWKLMGNTSLSGIGDGTVTGAISSLNTGIADKMFTVGTSKPVSGYAVNQDSYILRSQFGHVDLYLNVDAQTIQNTWNIIGYIPEGYRPPEYIRLVAYISDGSAELTPVHCFAYSNGDIKVYNPLPTGNYYLLIWGSYLIVR